MQYTALAGMLFAAMSVRLSLCSPLDVAANCESHYPRLSREAIIKGSKPYLLGGAAKSCTNCESDHPYAQFCGFRLDRNLSSVLADKDMFMRWVAVGKTENCAVDEQDSFLARMIALEEWSLLQLTPCDLWTQIHGRTIWFAGDSQTRDLFKAVECFMYEFWDGHTWEQIRYKHREPHKDDVKHLGADAVRPSCIDLPEGKVVVD